MMDLEAPARLANAAQALAGWGGRPAPAAARASTTARAAGLFEQAQQPLAFTSAEDGFASTRWNSAWFRAFGFEAGQAQGKSGPALGLWVNAGERERMLRQTLAGVPTQGLEVQLRRADGELRWVSLSTRILRRARGPLVLVSFLDITEALDLRLRQQEAMAELAQTRAKLLQLQPMAMLGSMASGIAREVERDLRSGSELARDLAEQARLAGALAQTGMRRGELRAFVESVRYASGRLTPALARTGELVGSFKQLAVDHGNGQRRRFQLAALVNDVLRATGSALALPEHWALANVPDSLWLDSYPGALGQVLVHLIDNAVRHGHGASGQGLLALTGRRAEQGDLVLEVRGAAMPAAVELADGHAGLGLRLARDLTERVLRGRLELQGRLESGTRATLALPCEA